MTASRENFVPRVITASMAAEGYNNEGRGELLGYIAEPDKHEKSCRYRITTKGDPDRANREPCTCRIGLWREKTVQQKITHEIERASKKRVHKRKLKPKKKLKRKVKRHIGRTG